MTLPVDRILNILHMPTNRFRASPQVGVACRMTWGDLAGYLSRPSVGEAKDEAGAWSPAFYEDNVRRKANLVSIGALVVRNRSRDLQLDKRRAPLPDRDPFRGSDRRSNL